jgi:ABC-type methionine transport system ATPase subunit
VEDNVTYGLRLRGMPADEAREKAGVCLEQVGLDHSFLVRKNTSLSAGQIARVVLARTLILEPEVLLLDEPTARLDPETADDLFALLREIQAERGTTILLTTPRLKEAEEFGRRIVVLLEGEVVSDVTIDEFLAGAVSDKARRYLSRSGY